MSQQPITLQQQKQIRSTNLQCIRFFAALAVIVCHAYPLCLGKEYQDILGVFTRGCMTFGGFAVAIFFFISGFFALQNVRQAKSFGSFLKKKLTRMLPALMLVVGLCALVIGPFISEYSFAQYFGNIGTYRYLLNGIFILQHDLPGVFTHNIYGTVVNGALWTMPVELLCLIACYCFKWCKLDNKKNYMMVLVVLSVGLIGANVICGNGSFVMSVLYPCMMFYLGIGCAVFDDVIVLGRRYLLLFVIGGGILFLFHAYYACILLLPYGILYISYALPQTKSVIVQWGNASYEMYVWGFVIQQFIVMCFGGSMNIGIHLLLAIPCVICFGYVTHVFLRLRKGAVK